MSGTTLAQALLVGAGGFVGSTLRYALGGLVHRLVPFASFPWGTLTVNLLGCLVIGLVTGTGEARQALGPEVRLFLMIGLLGGFTTFSTFGQETFSLARDREMVKALVNVFCHLALGLGAVWLGHALSRMG